MPMPKFLIYTTLGSAIWNTVITIVGSIVGKNWEKVLDIFDKYSHITLIVLIILFVIFTIVFFKKRKKED